MFFLHEVQVISSFETLPISAKIGYPQIKQIGPSMGSIFMRQIEQTCSGFDQPKGFRQITHFAGNSKLKLIFRQVLKKATDLFFKPPPPRAIPHPKKEGEILFSFSFSVIPIVNMDLSAMHNTSDQAPYFSNFKALASIKGIKCKEANLPNPPWIHSFSEKAFTWSGRQNFE